MRELNGPALSLRRAYDEQVRLRQIPLEDPGAEVDGPVRRRLTPRGTGFVVYRDLDGSEGAELDALIARQRDRFAALGVEVEWKHYEGDRPEDLEQRLTAAGFRAEEPETLMLGELADLALQPRLPPEIRVRRAESHGDFEQIAAVQQRVWGREFPHLPAQLDAMSEHPTEPGVVVLAEVDGEAVCGAWMETHPGTEFCSLWGGATAPEHRGRGVYRAVTALRAQLALSRGFRLAQVDCSEDSRPILQRLGLHDVGLTTPYLWRPDPA